jgi:hypothetical protein
MALPAEAGSKRLMRLRLWCAAPAHLRSVIDHGAPQAQRTQFWQALNPGVPAVPSQFQAWPEKLLEV